MSSNAFARSRPRVRHQRVPKTQCYAHPRFLKLVKELVRIDEAKKKLEESDHNDCSSSSSARDTSINGRDDTRGDGDDCSNTTGPSSTQHMITQQNIHHIHNNHHHHHHHHHHHQQHQQPHQQQHQQQQSSLTDCCPLSTGLASTNYCGVINEAHSSNGYRSLECSHSASALHDNYYRHNSNSDSQQQYTSHNIHHQSFHHHNHHQRHYNYPSNHQESFTQINNSNNLHHPHQDYRCPNKCSSSSTATNISIDHSKTGLIEYNNISGTDPDPRQDENRSKRKRSANDPLSAAKKTSPSTISPSSCSKRHKSSPEPARPLSPSFTKCPICLLDCMDRDPAFTNTCFHLFCFVCVENWSKSKATCPLCRTKFNKIIYNIRSESCFDEKIASPIRRDDDDDRIIYEQLQGLTANSIVQSRTSNVDETRQIFDNLRNNNGDVLMPHFAFVNQIDPRQVDTLHSFNSVTNNSSFDSSVPHTPFPSTNYNPVGSNYIALIPSNSRLPSTSTGPAITSAYTTSSLTNISSETRLRIPRIPRISRSGRYIHSGNYDLSALESSLRSRSTSTNLTPSGISLEPPHHNQIQHTSHHQHHSHHINQQQHRSTGTIELGSGRGSRGIEHPHIHIPYPIPPRHYTNPNVYSRRPYTNPPIEQHILDNLYRQMPDM